MSQQPHQSTESTDEDDDSGRVASLTRRDALVAAAGASILAKVNNERVTAQSADISVALDNFEDSLEKYDQFDNAEITELALGSGTEVTIDLGATTDSQLQLQGYFQINNSDKVQFANQIKSITDRTGDVTFKNQSGDLLWETDPEDKPTGVTIDADTDFDVEWLPIVDSDYANLRPPDQSSVEDSSDLAKKTECTITFEALSDSADIQETQTIEFDLHVAHPVGMGDSFATAFATDRPPGWPEDWDTAQYS